MQWTRTGSWEPRRECPGCWCSLLPTGSPTMRPGPEFWRDQPGFSEPRMAALPGPAQPAELPSPGAASSVYVGRDPERGPRGLWSLSGLGMLQGVCEGREERLFPAPLRLVQTRNKLGHSPLEIISDSPLLLPSRSCVFQVLCPRPLCLVPWGRIGGLQRACLAAFNRCAEELPHPPPMSLGKSRK